MPTVRPARADDLAVLVDFNAALARETESRELDRPTLERGVATLLADPTKGRYFVAEDDGVVVGALCITYEWSDWRNAVFWWIQSVYVRAEHRRTGVYTALYRAIEAQAREDAGVCGLRLYVDHDNARAQSVYAALGMRESHYRFFEIDFVLGA
jgi:ribosomal protein S18 acetylase RimI-like enzyme